MPTMGRQRVRYRVVVRFSIFDPGWTGWRATNTQTFAGSEDYRAHLWSPERLQPRLRIFGDLALPIYQQMAARHDVRVLVQHSPDLPEPWLGRLHDLATAFPVLRPVPVPGWVEARDTVRDDLGPDARSGTVVLLRVDDDDVLSADFLDQLAPHVTPAHHGWSISLGRGLVARLKGDALVDFRDFSDPLCSIGQTYLGAYDRRRRALDISPMLSHRRVPETLPTVVDSRSAAFVQVRHPGQDTRVGQDAEQTQQGLRDSMRRLPAITEVASLRPKFPTLSAAFDETERVIARRVARQQRAAAP